MKYEWKAGDKLRVVESIFNGIKNGDIVTASSNISTDDGNRMIDILDIKGEIRNGIFAYRFVKVSSSARQKPEELHVALIDSCKNFVSINRNYNDAIVRAKAEKEAVTVYKMVEVAKVSTLRTVRRIPPRKRKKVTKK